MNITTVVTMMAAMIMLSDMAQMFLLPSAQRCIVPPKVHDRLEKISFSKYFSFILHRNKYRPTTNAQ